MGRDTSEPGGKKREKGRRKVGCNLRKAHLELQGLLKPRLAINGVPCSQAEPQYASHT